MGGLLLEGRLEFTICFSWAGNWNWNWNLPSASVDGLFLLKQYNELGVGKLSLMFKLAGVLVQSAYPLLGSTFAYTSNTKRN